MQDIQTVCAELAAHLDPMVSERAVMIAKADFDRDLDYDNRIVELSAENSTLTAKLKVTTANNRMLRAQNNKFNDMLFGRSSEQGHPNKPEEPESDPQPEPNQPKDDRPDTGGAEAKPEKGKKPRGMRGKQAVRFHKDIPRDEIAYDLADEDVCECGCKFHIFGEQVVERLSFVPAQVRVTREIHKKYSCRDCYKAIQVPFPKRAFDYRRYDDKLIAGLLVGKFADYLPFYRLEQIFERSGVKLHRSTMTRLMDAACDALVHVHAALETDLKSSTKLFMDETVLAQLEPGSGKTKTCYVWALCRDDRRWKGNAPPGVAFHFKQSRKGAHAEEILAGFEGILQIDGYAGYNRLRDPNRVGGPVELAYCWAHVRRKFLDVHKATRSPLALEIFELINKLYSIEKDLKHQTAPVRLQVRQAEALPLFDQLVQRLREIFAQIAKKSPLGAAINYTQKLLHGLDVFLKDGRVEIDSNSVENTIRPIAMLRKNALFAGSEIGGKNWAIMASLIGTCKLNGVEPYAYITWVFKKMAECHPISRYDELLPWHCPKGRFNKK